MNKICHGRIERKGSVGIAREGGGNGIDRVVDVRY